MCSSKYRISPLSSNSRFHHNLQLHKSRQAEPLLKELSWGAAWDRYLLTFTPKMKTFPLSFSKCMSDRIRLRSRPMHRALSRAPPLQLTRFFVYLDLLIALILAFRSQTFPPNCTERHLIHRLQWFGLFGATLSQIRLEGVGVRTKAWRSTGSSESRIIRS